MLKKSLAALLTVAAFGVFAPGAQANHIKPNLAIQVTAVDAPTRTVTGVVHCATAEREGKTETFTVAPEIALDQFEKGAVWGIAVRPGNTIVGSGDIPCDYAPPVDGDDDNGSGVTPPNPDGGEGRVLPHFANAFLKRAWKFDVAVDTVDAIDGRTAQSSVTIEKVVGLPKKFRSQDDDLVDQEARVLIGLSTPIFKGGRRSGTGELEDSSRAIVLGKMLPTSKWLEDDGVTYPTIRAQRISITK